MQELAQQDYFRDFAARLEAAGRGERGKLLAGAQAMLGISRQQIYRQLQAVGWRSGRKLRADKGDTDVTDDEIKTIVNCMMGSTRENKKRLMTWEDAVEIAQANNLIQSNKHPATYSRIARARGLHPDQLNSPTPHQDMKSLYPNHVWQFDVSLCVLYYMDDNGLEPMDHKKFYQNKPQNMEKIKKKRVLRYLITDHCSGAMFLRYYLGSGEDQETLFEFLCAAFAESGHTQDPFHGVPNILVWDAGAANQSHLIKNLLQQLGVQHWAHLPGNPRAKGQVEGGHNIVERKFEGRLALMDIQDINHLNRAAESWMRHFNGTAIHRRHGHTRYAQWQLIRADQLRLCPPRPVLESLLQTKPETRRVAGNLTITYKVKGYGMHTYSVAHVPDIRVGEQVMVVVNPYQAPAIFVVEKTDHGDQFYTCEPIAKDAHGFVSDATVWGEDYNAKPDTEANKTRKAMDKAAYGADTQLEVDKARADRKPLFGGKIDPISYLDGQHAANYMARKGSELDIPNRTEVIAKPLSHAAAAKQLRGLGVDMDKGRYQQIITWYPDGVPEDEITALAQRLTEPQVAAPEARLQIVKG